MALACSVSCEQICACLTLLDPIANLQAVVFSQDGTARFTVLTPALIRMEYSANQEFEDRQSYSFVNR
jgi:alpha-glucosidase